MSSPLRLGILCTHPVQYFAPLFRELANRPGVDLTVYFAHQPTAAEQGVGFGVAFQWDIDTTHGYRHVWLRNRAARPSAATFDGCDTPEIGGIVRHGGFESFLVMGWHSRAYWQAMRAGWSAKVPVLVRGDSQLTGDRLPKRVAKSLVYPVFMRRFAACLSVGTRSEAYFRRYGATIVVRSPHFVDNVMFGSAAARLGSQRDVLRARAGIPANAFVACFAGKLIPKKRPLDLIRAAVRAGRADLWLAFAGDGELRDECEAEAARHGVNARFLGFQNQSQMPEVYALADAVVLPSDARETWGLVVNEAMASGRCAIVSDEVGCAPDLVIEDRTGHRFSLGDVERLGALLGELCDDRGRAARLSQVAERHVQTFNVASAADGILFAASPRRAEVAA